MITAKEIDNLVKEAESCKHALVFCEGLPIGHQMRIKRAHDQLSLAALSEIIKVPRTVLSEIECAKRSIPKKHEMAIHEYIFHQYFDGGEFVERWD